MRFLQMGNPGSSAENVTAVTQFLYIIDSLNICNFYFFYQRIASLIQQILLTVPPRCVRGGSLLEYARKLFFVLDFQPATTINFIVADIADSTIRISGRYHRPVPLMQCTDVVD